jgi:hypothetical protein
VLTINDFAFLNVVFTPLPIDYRYGNTHGRMQMESILIALATVSYVAAAGLAHTWVRRKALEPADRKRAQRKPAKRMKRHVFS